MNTGTDPAIWQRGDQKGEATWNNYGGCGVGATDEGSTDHSAPLSSDIFKVIRGHLQATAGARNGVGIDGWVFNIESGTGIFGRSMRGIEEQRRAADSMGTGE